MVRMYVGNEPYLIMKERERALKKEDMMNTLESNVFGEDELLFWKSTPFFAERKILVVNVTSLAELDTKAFYELVKEDNRNELHIFCEKVEKNRKVYKALDKAGAIVNCNRLDEKGLISFIKEACEERASIITTDALKLLMERLCYFANESVTLYEVTNEVAKLSFVAKTITCETVGEYVKSYEPDNVFALASMIRSGDLKGIFKELSLLETKKDYSPIKVLSLLERDYRIAYKKTIRAEASLPMVTERTTFSGLPTQTIKDSMLLINERIKNLKRGESDIKGTLEQLVLMAKSGF